MIVIVTVSSGFCETTVVGGGAAGDGAGAGDPPAHDNVAPAANTINTRL